MISVKQARQAILEVASSLEPATVVLQDACGLVLREDVIAPYDIPGYPQSSMDGYAFCFAQGKTQFRIIGEMVAGASAPLKVSPDEATRIFTGAPLPEGADTVVMQEKTSVNDGVLTLTDAALSKGANVRPKGAEVIGGSVAMAAGEYLSVAAIGFLASVGISQVRVSPRPRVRIILTGNELQEPGTPLTFGKVYNSNSIMLSAALRSANVDDISIVHCNDDPDQLTAVLSASVKLSDVVLLTGGVSVGDYDFVIRAAERSGVEAVFHKVKQKPGKPLFFGKKGATLIFGLPGNPSSALTCFFIYVLPAIDQIMGLPWSRTPFNAALTTDFRKVPGLTQFMKAKVEGADVTLMNAQESFRLHSFARANCLAELSEEIEYYRAGDHVKVYPLPHFI